MKLSKIALATAATLLSGAAFAEFVPLPVGVGVLEDDNIEYVLDAQGQVKTTGNLVVGDRLRAVITFGSIRNGDNTQFSALGGGGQELTGISEIEIKAIVGNQYIFGASAAFEAVYGTGAMAALYSQTPSNFTVGCGSIAVCEGTATDGSLWAVAGLQDADDFWVATNLLGINDVGVLKNLTATTKVVAANYALSILVNNTGYLFNEQVSALSPIFGSGGGDGKTDIIGSGDVLGGEGLGSPYVARSDFDFQLNRVPEPTSMSLIGLGLLGRGALSRKRKAS